MVSWRAPGIAVDPGSPMAGARGDGEMGDFQEQIWKTTFFYEGMFKDGMNCNVS